MIESIQDLVIYLREFHRAWSPVPGLDSAAIPANLPHGLRVLYQEFGQLISLSSNRAPFAAQDALLPLHSLAYYGDMVEFACENQGNWTCRCRLGEEDPPVFSDVADLWLPKPQGFLQVCDKLSHFLVTLSLQEAVMSCPCLINLGAQPIEDVFRITCEPLWLTGRYVSDHEPSHNFYSNIENDLLVMEWNGDTLWIGSHSDDALRLINEVETCEPMYSAADWRLI